LHSNGALKEAYNISELVSASARGSLGPYIDIDGNGISDVLANHLEIHLLGYEKGGYNDRDNVRHAPIDLINEGQWVAETRAHSVDGQLFSDADASVINRTVTLTQTKCAEARAYVSLGTPNGNLTFRFDYNLTRSAAVAEEFYVALVAGGELNASDVTVLAS